LDTSDSNCDHDLSNHSFVWISDRRTECLVNITDTSARIYSVDSVVEAGAKDLGKTYQIIDKYDIIGEFVGLKLLRRLEFNRLTSEQMITL